MPFNKLTEWLAKETELGAPNPHNAVLATATLQGVPHSRVVAIRTITSEDVLFFTQRDTRKYHELTSNPLASITFWLALQQRQVIIEGNIIALTPEENLAHWQTMPRDRQIRFSAYAPTSAQPIQAISELEEKRSALIEQFKITDIPMSEYYCGFRLLPNSFCFYTLGNNNFSEILKFTLQQQQRWQIQLISP